MAITRTTTRLFCTKSVVFIKGNLVQKNHRKVTLKFKKSTEEKGWDVILMFYHYKPQLCHFLNSVATKGIINIKHALFLLYFCFPWAKSCISRVVMRLGDIKVILRVSSATQLLYCYIKIRGQIVAINVMQLWLLNCQAMQDNLLAELRQSHHQRAPPTFVILQLCHDLTLRMTLITCLISS